MLDIPVTVIIPTMCGSERSLELQRAIASVHNQHGVPAKVLVVINGSRWDHGLRETIRNLPAVEILQLATPGISHARHQGRLQVNTPYFMCLDDDDALHPHALRALIDTFEGGGEDVGVVVADAYNTYRQHNYGFSPSAAHIERDPLDALVEANWLILQSSLFRTSRVPPHLFDLQTLSNECTMMAFNLAQAGIPVRVYPHVIATIYDRPDTESKSEHFITQEPKVLEWMLDKEIPAAVRPKLRRKLAAAYHMNSVYYLQRKRFGKSLAAHWQSVLIRDGDPYILYGRHIIREFVKSWLPLSRG